MPIALQHSSIPVFDPFGIAGDPGLPLARFALDPAEVEPELQQLSRLLGTDGCVRLLSIRVIRHKPKRRFVLEYDVVVSTATSERKLTLIGKMRARHDAHIAYHLLDTLWNAGFDAYSNDGISVPEPIGVISRFNLWLQRKVPGCPDQLSDSGGTALMRRVVDAVHKLHIAGVPTERSHTLVDELQILHERLARVAQEHPDWSQRIKCLLAACDRLGASLPTPVERGIHRDFYADQVIVDGERLYLLDFDLYCTGDPALDIGNFAGHIIEHSLRLSGDALAFSEREQALIERFVELTGPASRHAVAVYTTLTLVRHIYLSTLFPERRAFTGMLLELCEQRLGASPGGRP